jgi:uncharacterized protein
MDDIRQTGAWKRMQQFTEYVDLACRECSHIRYCRGGCPYNAIVAHGGVDKGVDCNCTAYRRIFDEISLRLNKEMYESADMEQVLFGSGAGRRKKPGIMALMRAIALK